MKLLETLTKMGNKKTLVSKPTVPLDERVIHSPVERSMCIYGHKEGTKEYFDMVEELEYLKKHDPSLYRKIMSLE